MANSEPSQVTPNNDQSQSSSFFSQRSRRQFGLYAAGVGFFALSALITRRALVRKYRATSPKFYQPSNRVHEVDGTTEGLEALSIATINVASISMMATGGLLWAFDISNIDDMRRKVRKNMGLEGGDKDSEAEKEMEEWLATVLSRMDVKGKAEKEKEVYGDKVAESRDVEAKS